MICKGDSYTCTRQATHLLVHPDGTRNPGGYVCREHGEAILREFREKLGEVWTMVPVDEYGEVFDADVSV